MKKCPVCGAIAFDDASLCYACLHSYERDGEEGLDSGMSPSGMPSPSSGEGFEIRLEDLGGLKNVHSLPVAGEASEFLQGDCSQATDGKVSFVISLTPRGESFEHMQWVCAIEPVCA